MKMLTDMPLDGVFNLHIPYSTTTVVIPINIVLKNCHLVHNKLVYNLDT